MRFIRRALVVAALALSTVPMFATGAAASGPIDGSACPQWIRAADVASYQGAWPDFAHAKAAAGVQGTWIKISEGSGYLSPVAQSQIQSATQAGVLWGGYDFATPNDDPGADALRFVQAGGAAGGLNPVLDLEQSSGMSEPAVVQWARTWHDVVLYLSHKESLLYTGQYPWFDDPALSSAFPLGLWVAAYPLAYSTPLFDSACGLSYPDAGAWGSWAAWQYTSVGDLGWGGNVDLTAITPRLWAQMTMAAPSAVVQDLQSILNFWQPQLPIPSDGIMGIQTIWALCTFQLNVLGVPETGKWDDASQAAYKSFLAAMTTLSQAQAAKAAQAQADAAKAKADAAAAIASGTAAAKAKADAAALIAKQAAEAKAGQDKAKAEAVALVKFHKSCYGIVLRQGMNRPCVGYAQSLLVKRGFSTPIDGKFGPLTTAAVVHVQTLSKTHITPSGAIGVKTWKVLK